MLAACGSGPIPEGEADFRSCRGFLTLDEIKMFLGKPHIVFRAAEVTQQVQVQNADIVEACVVGFETNNRGASIQMAAHKFSSELAAADGLLAVSAIVDEVGRGETQFDTFGPDSYQLDLNRQGVGGVAGFKQGRHLIELRSKVAEGENPIADIEVLVTLAQVIQDRLP